MAFVVHYAVAIVYCQILPLSLISNSEFNYTYIILYTLNTEVRARWKDYFASLLQTDVQPQQAESREVPGEEGEMEESVEEITLEEI